MSAEAEYWVQFSDAVDTVFPYSKTSHVPGTGEKQAGNVCAGGAEGRVGCKAFDQMAGELEA
jgi:hypothetical protein